MLSTSDLRADEKTVKRLTELRRKLHAMPELGFQEKKTAAFVANQLDDAPFLGDELKIDVAKTGVVTTLRGKLPGRRVLVRADMDGLPLKEESELSFRSRHDGVMHACGHDVHMAIALTLAQDLSVNTHRLPGTVRFIFQPAEELAGGAQPMIEAGVLDGIDRVLGLHVWAGLPTGQVSVRPGPMMASADWFRLTVEGKGGHGAQPHLTVDPVVISAQIITALQTLVSRETSPIAPVVLTLGSIRGGTAHNIVASGVVIEGTLRTFDADLRRTLLRRIEGLAQGIAGSMRGTATFRQQSGAPPVVNDELVAALVAGAARTVVGADNVTAFEPLMVGEDVSYFLEQRPGCFFLLGGAPAGPPIVHHTAGFRIDERCLAIGYEVMAASLLRLLEE